jgi:hypothetical protein
MEELKMIRRLAIASALILASSVAFTSKASAQDAVVEFSGTLAGSCTFGSPNSGTLNFSGSTITTTSNGTINVTCNSPGTITVATPTAASVPQGVTIATTAATISGNGQTVTSADAGLTVVPGQETPINVSMTASSPANLIAGAYNFTVTLTATP